MYIALLFSPVPFTGCLRAYRFHFTSLPRIFFSGGEDHKSVPLLQCISCVLLLDMGPWQAPVYRQHKPIHRKDTGLSGFNIHCEFCRRVKEEHGHQDWRQESNRLDPACPKAALPGRRETTKPKPNFNSHYFDSEREGR